MTTTPVPSILHYLRTCLGPSDGGPAPDAHLLQCFAHGHDEVAFEALLRRHGPLVLGAAIVCAAGVLQMKTSDADRTGVAAAVIFGVLGLIIIIVAWLEERK